ncbi:MAG: FTR1 family protein, partial [Mycobacteriales bacterium]
SYGIHDLQEAGTLPGLNSLAFDVSGTIPPSSWYGTLLKGVFNFQPATTVLQAVGWVAYLVPVLVLFFRPARAAAPTAAPKQPVSI